MSTFYDENGNEKETMQSEETENLRKRKRKKKDVYKRQAGQLVHWCESIRNTAKGRNT